MEQQTAFETRSSFLLLPVRLRKQILDYTFEYNNLSSFASLLRVNEQLHDETYRCLLRKFKFTYVCITSNLTNQLVRNLRHARTSWPGDFIPDSAITNFPHYSAKFDISHPSYQKWPKAHLMLIGDLALKDFLYRISVIGFRQHQITATFTECDGDKKACVQLHSKFLQLLQYFWWDYPHVEILNAIDADAAAAAIHAPKFSTFLELAGQLETLRAKGNEDFQGGKAIAALCSYERARHIYYANPNHTWMSETGPDLPNLEVIRFNLFTDTSAAYLKLAEQGGPDQLLLGIAAVDAAQAAFPPPPYFRPSEAQVVRNSRILGTAAHLIGDFTVARWALKKVADREPDDLTVQREQEEVMAGLALGSPSRPYPKLYHARWKNMGWCFRFVAEKMVPIKL